MRLRVRLRVKKREGARARLAWRANVLKILRLNVKKPERVRARPAWREGVLNPVSRRPQWGSAVFEALELHGDDPSPSVAQQRASVDVGASTQCSTDGGTEVCPYTIEETDWRDLDTIQCIERCQAGFVADHGLLYKESYPDIPRGQWYDALSCGSIRENLRAGVRLMHAYCLRTGQIIGYTSFSIFMPPSSASAKDRSASGAGTIRTGRDEQPYCEINHLMVLPSHRGRGIGTALYNKTLECVVGVAPRAAEDVRITVVELNARARDWYWRLGFGVDRVDWSRLVSSLGDANRLVVFLKMRRLRGDRQGDGCTPFGPELVGERINFDGEPKALTVASYDLDDGLHTLEDGRSLDITACFACGRIRFERPLHMNELLRKIALAQEAFDDVGACTGAAAAAASPGREPTAKLAVEDQHSGISAVITDELVAPCTPPPSSAPLPAGKRSAMILGGSLEEGAPYRPDSPMKSFEVPLAHVTPLTIKRRVMMKSAG
jgi:ribosomal protein S18 acetylase RimI-like enzyme